MVLFESVYLGYFQPSFEESGIPMLLLTTTDADGETSDRMLARFETDGKIYLSAHHWPRGWPTARTSGTGTSRRDYRSHTAVPISGAEFERVAADHPLPLPVRFLMGFPPLGTSCG